MRRLVSLGEQHVVVGVRVERRIEIDEIDRRILNVQAENRKWTPKSGQRLK